MLGSAVLMFEVTRKVVVRVLDVVTVVSSLHPNQPGVLQIDVVYVVVLVADVKFDVVDGSKQPHQPGVLQISVLVRLAALVLVVLVVVSVPLLSKNFQVSQSLQLVFAVQFATPS